MKLGIVVVYMVEEGNEKLLAMHLSQIEKNTSVPYTIYGSVNRLLPKFLPKLKNNPRVKICDCESTSLRGPSEHSFYLEQLIKSAVQDGATHVAILHVDSFPISRDWVQKLSGKLANNAFAGIVRDSEFDCKPLTACIFFHKDFYLKNKPSLLIPEDDKAAQEYRNYTSEFKLLCDSGSGYGFKAYTEGLSWHPMFKSNKYGHHHSFGAIYDDLIFHLGAALSKIKYSPKDMSNKLNTNIGQRLFTLFRKSMSKLFPKSVLDWVRDKVYRDNVYVLLPDKILDYIFPGHYKNAYSLAKIKNFLVNDPEGYFEFLRYGRYNSSQFSDSSEK